MIFLNVLVLVVIFVSSSLLSGYLMTKAGYPPPKRLVSREDYILLAMKLISFAIITLLSLALFMLLGIDPLKLL